MKITFILLCEKAVYLSGGRPCALDIYMFNIPWRPPSITIPIALMLQVKIEKSDIKPKTLSVHAHRKRGHSFVIAEQKLPQVSRQDVEKVLQVIMESKCTVPSPGEYEIQLFLDKKRLKHPPWLLTFVSDPSVGKVLPPQPPETRGAELFGAFGRLLRRATSPKPEDDGGTTKEPLRK